MATGIFQTVVGSGWHVDRIPGCDFVRIVANDKRCLTGVNKQNLLCPIVPMDSNSGPRRHVLS